MELGLLGVIPDVQFPEEEEDSTDSPETRGVWVVRGSMKLSLFLWFQTWSSEIKH
jgi:hypothetical protein